jgi:hypothetical protein
MIEQKISPRINHFSWGNIEIEDGRRMKDAKVYPGGAREWDWRETGTRHIPGILPQDVEELLENGADEIILSKGVLKCLRVCPETLAILNEKSIKVHVLQTEKAVELYNKLCKSKAVGGLFHSTC